MNTPTNKAAVQVESHARSTARQLRIAREGAKRSSLRYQWTCRDHRVLSVEKPSQALLPGKQKQSPLQNIGKSIEYRDTQRRAGLNGACRDRHSRKSQYRKGGENRVLMGSASEVEKDERAWDQREAANHAEEEHPVYWKLLQKVLADLGLTEEQWKKMYVDG